MSAAGDQQPQQAECSEQQGVAGTSEPAEAAAAATSGAGEAEATTPAPEQEERRCDSDASTEVWTENFHYSDFLVPVFQ